MKAVLLSLLLPGLALAELPPDAPIDDPPLMVIVKEGELIDRDGSSVSVDKGLYLNDAAAIKVAQRIASAEAENESLKASLANTPDGWSPLAVIAVGVVCLLVGGGAVLALQR